MGINWIRENFWNITGSSSSNCDHVLWTILGIDIENSKSVTKYSRTPITGIKICHKNSSYQDLKLLKKIQFFYVWLKIMKYKCR